MSFGRTGDETALNLLFWQHTRVCFLLLPEGKNRSTTPSTEAVGYVTLSADRQEIVRSCQENGIVVSNDCSERIRSISFAGCFQRPSSKANPSPKALR